MPARTIKTPATVRDLVRRMHPHLKRKVRAALTDILGCKVRRETMVAAGSESPGKMSWIQAKNDQTSDAFAGAHPGEE